MPSSNKVRKVTSENYPTDSGREGELIFRLVYQQAGCKKPVSRLWLSSMEENAIREGFAHLKPSTEYDALYNAALCRERADWMVGINASRLFSCLYADLYDSASFEAKKMIVSQLIRRVDVYRGYQIHVDFNFDLAQYLENSDELAC